MVMANLYAHRYVSDRFGGRVVAEAKTLTHVASRYEDPASFQAASMHVSVVPITRKQTRRLQQAWFSNAQLLH